MVNVLDIATKIVNVTAIIELNLKLRTQNKTNMGKVCDIKGCNDEATDIIDCENIQDHSVYMCSKHYRYFTSDESLGKHIDLKGVDGHPQLYTS